ncbi:MAG: WbqC family protein [Hymenobacteraceae bacterium]|nr:WbqC family protein [Hymenobacteraceae bacterium]MDX5395509.1 WbqC family protein [Hymenobacteraceae bacterium]MDX5442909.1 WbqC family protein [Hymenobacteraceae bacterium]MDX5511563.1 WbqC family protein [Hymenobacteraceae bacterium]
MVLLTETQYNPPIAFFSLLKRADGLLLEQWENYMKQSYRNRCHILTSHGVQALAVPVKKGNKKIRITDIEIDYQQKWLDQHLRTIQSGYGSAPFFEYYKDYFWQVYEQQPRLLWDLNLSLLKLYLKFLKLKKEVQFTQEWHPEYEGITQDMRNKLHPKIQPDNLNVLPYKQVFGKQFAPYLSIMDLLFNQGPEAQKYL